MEFVLDCTLALSRDPKGINIEQYIKEAEQVLGKGAPPGEGARIDKYSATGDRLDLSISSGRYVRPHDAVFRLKNLLSQKLGKEHRIGVREVTAEKYVIKFELEKEPKKEFGIPFAKETRFEGKNCKLVLVDLSEEFLQRNYVDRMITLVKEKVEAQHYEGKAEHWELLWQSGEKKHAWDKDPTTEMERRGWIMHRGRGQWIFGPLATKIMKTMERIVCEELLTPLKFSEVIIPKAVTWDVWKKSGHAKNIYGEIYYLCQPKTRDREYWEEVTDTYKITGEVPLNLIKDRIREPIGGVSYAQCPPLWPYFDGRTIADESLPIKVFDRSGTSMRYESGGIHGIERVDEFHRIEVVWAGYPEQVRKVREEIVERYKHVFNDLLDLEWRMAWVTPWFMAQEGLIGVKDEKDAVHDIGTIDFESYLPYRGTRNESEWLEFQNASNNGDKYPKGFNVKSRKGTDLWSGC
ncbi:MAG: serine--tRNA ligase, partial [Candidatus Altiarchaeota archaeon]|nr:serine--tRNA ligase [Candidatus Altiarchaeota archaeon]